jgi:uncharacterized protein (TIGR03437 family)
MKWVLAPVAALLLSQVQGLEAQVTLNSAVNAASYANPILPNGNLTQGGVFIAFGSGMGPAKLQEISAYPLPTNLAGTSIAVTVNGKTVNCIMLYTSANQVAAVLPSDTPAGVGSMVLSYNESPSSALNVTVVEHNFGIFSVNQSGGGAGVITNAITNVVNSQTESANASQLLDLWGTGLGPVAGNEADGPLPGNIPNLPIQVFIAGQQAQVNYAGRSGCCTGLDEVEIVVTAGIVGCAVPPYVVVGGVTSNFVTVSIAQSGSACDNPNALTASELANAKANGGLRIGSAGLIQSHQNTAKTSPEADTVGLSFSTTPYVDLTLVPQSPPPMVNTCNITASGGSLPAGYEEPTPLAAGTVTLSGEIGPYPMLLEATGEYGLVFEPTGMAQPGIIADGTELTPGTYTFTGTAVPQETTSVRSTSRSLFRHYSTGPIGPPLPPPYPEASRLPSPGPTATRGRWSISSCNRRRRLAWGSPWFAGLTRAPAPSPYQRQFYKPCHPPTWREKSGREESRCTNNTRQTLQRPASTSDTPSGTAARATVRLPLSDETTLSARL